MRGSTRVGALMLGFAALTACAADAPPAVPSAPSEVSPMPAVASLASVTEAALADAANRSGLARDALKVLSAEAVTWSDGSLGCPQPGMMYTQALVPGYRVRIEAGGQVLDYHAGRSGRPALCPAQESVEPIPANAARI